MSIEPSAGLREKSVGLRGDWIASITNVVIFLFICLQGLASSSAITANASNVLPYQAGRIIHPCAVAGRRGLILPLREFGSVSARVPVIADVAPIGTRLMPDLARRLCGFLVGLG